MKVVFLAALGCLFWLLPLGVAVSMFARYAFYEGGFGFNYDSLPLLGIPASRIGVTLLLAYLASRDRCPEL